MPATEWHLKEGDKTKRVAAARIYFTSAVVEERMRVLILYCGPHPECGFTAHVDIPRLPR